jgi:hypothetical protein
MLSSPVARVIEQGRRRIAAAKRPVIADIRPDPADHGLHFRQRRHRGVVGTDEVAEQLGEVLNLDMKAFAVPRAGWAEAFEQFGVPKGHTGPAEEMFEAVNAGWMDLGVEGTEHVAGTTSARDVFEAAQNAANFCLG